MQSPFKLLEQRFMPLYEKQLSKLPKVQLISECECCKRKSSDFNGEAYQFTDSYKTTHTVCNVCAMFNIQNGELLGEERDNVAYRMTSFKGGYLVVPVDSKKPMELWMGGKYLQRLKESNDIKIVALSGHKAKAELLENSEEKLVISLSVRRELYFRNLKMSTDKTLNVATETGSIGVNYSDYHKLKKAVEDVSLTPALKKELIRVLRLTKRNLISVTSQDAVKLFSKLPQELLMVVKDTTQDPIGMMFILDAFSA